MSKYRIFSLNKTCQKDNFNCGIEELNLYLIKYASQDIKRKFAQVIVICPSNSEEIIGFYSLSASAIKISSLPSEIAKKLPKYPVPVSLLGRLAVGAGQRDLNWSFGTERVALRCFLPPALVERTRKSLVTTE
jgi:hypothetical protein